MLLQNTRRGGRLDCRGGKIHLRHMPPFQLPRIDTKRVWGGCWRRQGIARVAGKNALQEVCGGATSGRVGFHITADDTVTHKCVIRCVDGGNRCRGYFVSDIRRHEGPTAPVTKVTRKDHDCRRWQPRYFLENHLVCQGCQEADLQLVLKGCKLASGRRPEP